MLSKRRFKLLFPQQIETMKTIIDRSLLDKMQGDTARHDGRGSVSKTMNFLRKIFGQDDGSQERKSDSSLLLSDPATRPSKKTEETDVLFVSFANDLSGGPLDKRDLAEPDASLREDHHDDDELIGDATIVGEIADSRDESQRLPTRGRKSTYSRQVGTGKGRKAVTRAENSSNEPKRPTQNLADFSDMEELDDSE